jgi:hypothetical protein
MLLVRGARPLAGAAARRATRSLSTTNNKFVLTLNAGSSSIKFGVFDVAGGTPVERCSGIVEEVGSDHSRLKLVVDGEVKRDVADLHIKGHGEALASIRDALAPQLPGEIAAVGHRVVHGGASILGAVRRPWQGRVFPAARHRRDPPQARPSSTTRSWTRSTRAPR